MCVGTALLIASRDEGFMKPGPAAYKYAAGVRLSFAAIKTKWQRFGSWMHSAEVPGRAREDTERVEQNRYGGAAGVVGGGFKV